MDETTEQSNEVTQRNDETTKRLHESTGRTFCPRFDLIQFAAGVMRFFQRNANQNLPQLKYLHMYYVVFNAVQMSVESQDRASGPLVHWASAGRGLPLANP